MRPLARAPLFFMLCVVPGCTPGCGETPANRTAAGRPAARRETPVFPAGKPVELGQIPPEPADILRGTYAFPLGTVEELKPGDPRITHPPTLPVLTITQPAAGTAAKPGVEIPCVVRVVLPPGASLPSFVMFSRENGNVVAGQFNGIPLRRDPDGAYLYGAKFKLSRYFEPGDWKLYARGIVYYCNGPLTDLQAVRQQHRVASPPVKLQAQ